MSNTSKHMWKTLESYRSTAFTVAGLSFTFGLSILLFNVAQGADSYTDMSYYLLQRTSSGAAWAAIFLGVLGFRSSLSNNSGWTLRVGTVFAVIGFVTGLMMVVVFVGLYTGLLGGGESDYEIYILFGYLFSAPLGCGIYGLLILTSKLYTTTTGLLILVSPATFLLNVSSSLFIDYPTIPKTTVIVFVLMLANLSIAYLLISGPTKTAVD